MEKALITRIVSNRYTIYHEGAFHIATAMGKLRLGIKPIVGDYVLVDYVDEKWRIQEVLERKNHLIRPLVANIDQALIVMSAKEPDFSYTLVDRLIFLISLEHILPVIIVSKADLDTDGRLQEIASEYRQAGYDLIVTGDGVDPKPLEDILRHKLSVLAGQSGVGKSSILNRFDATLQLQTQEISKALGRGKHTTRHNQLYQLGEGWIADTPGFSSLDFSNVDVLELAQRVPDFQEHLGACRYRDCVHINEPGCIVKMHVETGKISKRRYMNYVDVVTLITKGEQR